MNYDSPIEIRNALEGLGVRLQKRWGQNFLVNPHVRRRIVDLLDPLPSDTVWEVGPGLGSLTVLLLRRVRMVVAFELDWGFIRFLEQELGEAGRFELVQGNVLKTWKRELAKRGAPARVVGNLPYATASAFIADLAEAELRPPRMVFTVQREVARRMTSRPGGKAYSSFSVLCQVTYRVDSCMELKPGSFYPAPQVSSSVVVLTPEQEMPQPRDRELFLRLVRAMFRSRRKTLWNNLLAAGFAGDGRAGEQRGAAREALAAEGIEPGRRSETLEPEQFVRLADRLAGLTGRGFPGS